MLNLVAARQARAAGLLAQRLQLGNHFQVARAPRGALGCDQPLQVQNLCAPPKKSNIDGVINQV